MLLDEADPDDYLYGLIIRQGREKRGLTQEQFAELVDADLRTIQRWEAGECIPWPSFVKRVISIMPDIASSLCNAIKKKSPIGDARD